MINLNQVKGIYIPSVEACDVYSHEIRGKGLHMDYVGFIPFSLELIKLKKEGMDIFTSKKHPNKELTNDVINVKFKQKVLSGKELIKKCKEKIKNSSDKEYIDKLQSYIEEIEANIDQPEWKGVSGLELRHRAYTQGLTIYGERYIFYKRSSSKSRKGEALFIKEHLYNNMTNWSRMNLPLVEGMEIDLAGLMAYESLVGSSLERLIEINPENILIVDDVISTFNEVCNVVRMNHSTKKLDSFEENVSIANELFDGEALLDSELFPNNKAMMLLRNHMFKAAAFATNIQHFMKDYFGENYETATVTDMFGNKMKVTDIKMIITPSCLKALKFSDVVGGQAKMWEHWKQTVKADGNLFGVCKYEKQSQRGTDAKGNILQQTSYQMLNSLPATEKDIMALSKLERDYIMKLKNNDEVFIKHIKETANDVNANQMFVDLYNTNKNIVKTKVFKQFKKLTISKYVTYVKQGKIRLIGDYCVMLGNPIEFLYHAVGKKITEPIALKENEVYTTMFGFNKELVGFRNPHTSQSNVLIVKNTYNKLIEKYIKLTDNIVIVNTINFNLPNILSGSDFDSDTVALFDNKDLLHLAKQCYGHYKVCVNDIESEKKQYRLTLEDACVIDNQLAKSTTYIGEVVNTGQLALSIYWDKYNNGADPNSDEMIQLLKHVDVMTVLSGVAIDLAKKFYAIDIPAEINAVRNSLKTGDKPRFWRFVTDKKNAKKLECNDYNCPMDILYSVMSDLPKANYVKTVDLVDLLVKKDNRKGNRRQITKVKEMASELQARIAEINTRGGDSQEVFNQVEDVTNLYIEHFDKLKINDNTMYAILLYISKELNNTADKQVSNSFIRLMNQLYKTQNQVFLKAFKVKK